MTIADKRKEYRLINILFKTIYKKKAAKWRGDYLRNKHIFHQIGNNVHLWAALDKTTAAMGHAAQSRVNENFLWQNSAELALTLLPKKGKANG